MFGRRMPLALQMRRLRKKVGLFRSEARIHWETSGLRGVFSLYANLLCGSPKLVLRVSGSKHPLCVRLRTSDAEVYREVLQGGEYDFPIPFSPRSIIDVGANCGITSIYYANRYPEATIWALEPETSNYEALVRNTRAHPNVIPIQAALWKADGQVEIFSKYPRFSNWDKYGFRARQGTGCPDFNLTTFMRRIGIEMVDILKIDIEAGEKEIFETCDWMHRVRLLAIELHDRDTPGCTEAVDAAAHQHRKVQHGWMAFYQRD